MTTHTVYDTTNGRTRPTFIVRDVDLDNMRDMLAGHLGVRSEGVGAVEDKHILVAIDNLIYALRNGQPTDEYETFLAIRVE